MPEREFSKEEALRAALERWRDLPADRRRTVADAAMMSKQLVGELRFRTMADPQRLIFSWLVRELDGLPPWGNIRPQHGPNSAH